MIKLESKNIRLRLIEGKNAGFAVLLRLDNRYNIFLSSVNPDIEI